MSEQYTPNFKLADFFSLKGGIEAITRNKKTKHYNYADLNAIRESLEEHLGTRWVIQDFQNGREVITRIYDTENDFNFIQSVFLMADDLDPQDAGKAITYGRRYNRITLLDLQTEDNDAAGVRRTAPKAERTARVPRASRRTAPKDDSELDY